ncbi:MAG: ABC transporter permease [Oscillospiraceae bacterium]
MNLRENIRLAVNGLRANKMRALLTMLGIIIGISSVITIVTVGNAMTSSVTSVLNDLGANSIQLQITDQPDEYGNTNWSRSYEPGDYISNEMISLYMEAFGDQIKALAVSKSVGSGQAMNGRNEATGYVVGVNANALGIQNIEIVAGHDLNDREVVGVKNVAVISDRFVQKLFPGISLQEALGREIKLRLNQGMFTFTVVGVYHYEITGMMASMTGDTTTNVFIPVGAAEKIMNNVNGGYYAIQVRANDGVDSKLFAAQTEEYFNKHFYRGNKYVQTIASSMDSMIGQMTTMMSTMSLAIGVIAAISLLVGGIGVMNIMLVSVTERTREIGTRKALGAKNSAIRIQFIVESMIICLIGGVIGVALGTLFGRLGSGLLGAPGWPTMSIVLIAVSFSMGIGVFFGYYPANKAAKLDPIEALRYE